MKKGRMRPRDLKILVAGLLVGMIAGILGATALGGTAFSDDNSKVTLGKPQGVNFYLVKTDQVSAWLAEAYPQESETVKSTFDLIAKLPTSSDFRAQFKSTKPELDSEVLPKLYAALIDPTTPQEGAKADVDEAFSVCLGMEDDPFSPAPTLYFYLTIPTEHAKTVEVLSDWEQIAKPKTNELYWQLLACYPEPDEKASS